MIPVESFVHEPEFEEAPEPRYLSVLAAGGALAAIGWAGMFWVVLNTLPTIPNRWLFFAFVQLGLTGTALPFVRYLHQRFAPRAKRAHDDLVLPDASGTPVALKALFDKPRDLMAALNRGGWIIPGEPDRSMLLIAIIGTGPMQDILEQADIDLLSDWVTAGAPIPPAVS